MLKVKQLQAMRNRVTVLENINLEILKGQSYALQGSSGCGKSTLLKTLVGGCSWRAEEFLFDGQPVSPGSIQNVRQFTGYIGQENALSGSSVEECLKQPFAFAAYKNRTFSKTFSKRELHRLIQTFSLPESLLQKAPSELSGGQKQRFCIIRTLLLQPKLIIADEPTSALDKNNRNAVIEELLNQKHTVISTSHDQQWLDNCDQLIFMKDGRIIREPEYV